MSLGLVDCCVLIHAKQATRRSWDSHEKPGFYIGPAPDSYRCFKLVKTDTKSQVISDTVKIYHSYLSVPMPSAEDKIIHGLQVVAGAIWGTPPHQVSPNSKLLLCFKKSLSHGARLLLYLYGPTTARLPQVQG